MLTLCLPSIDWPVSIGANARGGLAGDLRQASVYRESGAECHSRYDDCVPSFHMLPPARVLPSRTSSRSVSWGMRCIVPGSLVDVLQ